MSCKRDFLFQPPRIKRDRDSPEWRSVGVAKREDGVIEQVEDEMESEEEVMEQVEDEIWEMEDVKEVVAMDTEKRLGYTVFYSFDQSLVNN
jgi:hypothetical protein